MECNKLTYTLPKSERLCSRKALEELFGDTRQSFMAYPIRAVFIPTEETGARIMVSVSKRYFKRAVKRNLIKRQLREAYRLQKHIIAPAQGGVNIAFLWSSNEIIPTQKVFAKMQTLLTKINNALTNIAPTE